MKINFLFPFFLFFLITYCKKEDEVEPPRDFQEQSIADEKKLEDFLSSHFYNYEEFQDSESQPDLVFDSLSLSNSEKTPLIDQVKKKLVPVITPGGLIVNHPIYTLIVWEGNGQSPSKADSTYVSYEGLLLNNTRFDRSYTPIWFDLTSVVKGFREGMPDLKSGEFTVDKNNVTTFNNYGQGAIFMPSGLGYFGSSTGSIPEYSPLIFKINLYLVKQTDHDGDGILSGDEYDNNNDGIPDDSDNDGLPDYLDGN